MTFEQAPHPTGESRAVSRTNYLFYFLAPALSILILFVLAEIVLRFLPVNTGLASTLVDTQNPIFRFTPNRNYIYSVGWDMHRIVHGRVNNDGWVNAQDYQSKDPVPLLAVVGNSYIEALMVDQAETMQARLSRTLSGKLRVYSFAASGAPLSQYLIWAGYAVHQYGAKAVVINVEGNDFDNSLCQYKKAPGFWCYAPDADRQLRLRLIDHRPGWATMLVRKSALARYLLLNLQTARLVFDFQILRDFVFGRLVNAQPQYAGNTKSVFNDERLNKSLLAIDAFFRDLPEAVGLPPEQVLFTLDGFRNPAAAQAGHGSYFDRMREAFRAKAEMLGYEIVDLDRWFLPLGASGKQLSFPDDGHWNIEAHAVVARAVASSRLLARMGSLHQKSK
jgi:hypothetical protein